MSEFVKEWKTVWHSTYLLFLCVSPTGEVKASKVDFLGMSVDGAAAIVGQWVLLVLGVVLLLATILLAYKYRKSKKPEKSLSTMELKQKD